MLSVKQFIQSFKELISNRKQIVIVSHVNPDGDAVGSSLALCKLLRKLGCNVKVVLPNDFPSFLAWMPGIDDVFIFDKDIEAGTKLLAEADLVCMLDFNHPSRCGLVHNALCASKAPKVLIDHHRDAELDRFVATLIGSDIASSTSELVADCVFEFGDKYLDSDIADCLLVGIMTDTGSFAHSVFSRDVFDVCARLVTKSNNYTEIHQRVYNTFSEKRLRMLGFSISDRMTVLPEYSTAFIALSRKDLDLFDYQVGDTEGIVNYPLTLDGINMSVLITERQVGTIRFSFRSEGSFSVHELSRKYFNGGGHTNAAGGTMQSNIEQAVKALLDVLPEYKDRLNSSK